MKAENGSRFERPDGDFAPDPVVSQALAALDPATGDPNYWLRFRGWVMDRASLELARRRRMALTVPEVMTSWARTVLPSALIAAAVAGLLLLRSPRTPPPAPLSIEELLVAELDDDPIPAALQDDGDAVIFVAERF